VLPGKAPRLGPAVMNPEPEVGPVLDPGCEPIHHRLGHAGIVFLEDKRRLDLQAMRVVRKPDHACRDQAGSGPAREQEGAGRHAHFMPEESDRNRRSLAVLVAYQPDEAARRQRRQHRTQRGQADVGVGPDAGVRV